MLLELDDKDEKVRLVLNGGDVLETLQDQGEKINPKCVSTSILYSSDYRF